MDGQSTVTSFDKKQFKLVFDFPHDCIYFIFLLWRVTIFSFSLLVVRFPCSSRLRLHQKLSHLVDVDPKLSFLESPYCSIAT
jgi:hypothetical protein